MINDIHMLSLFNGLEKISQREGKIYKKKTADGNTVFFQAQGFWSKIYHFLFSKRLNINDIKEIRQKVTQFSSQMENQERVAKVNEVFQNILNTIKANPSLHLKQLIDTQISSPSTNLNRREKNLSSDEEKLKKVLSKFEARQKSPSLTSQIEEVLSYDEINLMNEWQSTLEISFRQLSNHQNSLSPVKNKTNNVSAAIEKMQKITNDFISIDIEALKKKALNKKLSLSEIDKVIEAKKLRVELQNTVGSYLNLESFRKSEKGLNHLFELSTLQSKEIDEVLFNHYYQEHHAKFNQAKTKKFVLVEGAGPNGLMTALKLYMAGARVSLINNREESYSRGQILRLDPKWVSELYYYLGQEFDQMLKQGYAVIKPSGYVEISTNQLEDALKARLASIWSKENLDQELSNKNFEESKHLNLRYDIEMKSIASRPKNGFFQAHLGKRNHTAIDVQNFDTIIFAGGFQDPLRTQYLCPTVRQTTEKDYIVTVWERQKQDTDIAKYANKEDFRGTFKGLFNNFTTYFNQALTKSNLSEKDFDEKLFNQLKNEMEKLKQLNLEMDYRFFENSKNLYLGLQYPPEFSMFIKIIEEAKEKEINVEKKKIYDKLIKEIDNQLIVESFNKLKIKIDSKIKKGRKQIPAFNSISTNRFPVFLSATSVQAKVLKSDETKVFMTVAGDALASPHFFSGSGLSAGRQGTNHLVETMEDIMLNGKSLEIAAEDLNKKQATIVDFTLARGKIYTPLLNADSIEKNQYDATVKIVEEAMKNEIYPEVKIKKTSKNNHYVLSIRSSEYSFKISSNGKLVYEGQEFIILLDLVSSLRSNLNKK